MKRLLITLAALTSLLACAVSPAATKHTDAAASYAISSTSWGANGLPARPDAEWRFGGGLAYDTSGGVFINYGQASLATGLTISNGPGLAEGILAPHQSALSFNRATNRLLISNSAVLDCAAESYSVVAVVRAPGSPLAGQSTIASKKETNGVSYPGWEFYFFGSNLLVLMSDGSTEPVALTDVSAHFGRWIVAGFSYSQAGVCSLFVNGTYANRLSSGGFGSLANAKRFNVGTTDNGANPFGETIALLEVWDGTALSAAQMAAVAAALLPEGGSGEPYPSIQSAVQQASSGDTILIAVGSYRETVTVDKSLDYLGSIIRAGSRPTLLGAGLPSSAGTTGLRLQAKSEIGFLNVRGYSSLAGIWADSTSDGSLLHHLTVDSCLEGVRFYGRCDGDSLLNCTIDGASLAGSYGVRTVASSEGGSSPLVWLNNIIYRTGTGLAVDSVKFAVAADYNALFGGTTAYTGISAGSHDLALDPLFLGDKVNDYRLRIGSKLYNRGLLIHSGAPPFDPNQWNPDLGAIESPAGLHPAQVRAWGRSAWGRRE